MRSTAHLSTWSIAASFGRKNFGEWRFPLSVEPERNLPSHLGKAGILQISPSRISNCSMAKIVSGRSLRQAETLLHLGRNGLLFAELRYFRHSRPAWMTCPTTHVRPSSWTNWKAVLLHGSRQHRFEWRYLSHT